MALHHVILNCQAFLFLGEANIRGYGRNLKEKQDSMPEGVKEVQEWYYLYVFTQDNSDTAKNNDTFRIRTQSCNLGKLITSGMSQKKIYHEKYRGIGGEDSNSAVLDHEYNNN